jgi:uncharacterized membrane protein
MTLLILGLVLWCAVHLIPSLGAPLKAAMIARLGNAAWRGLFSLLLVLGIVLMVFGWRSALPTPVYVPPAPRLLAVAVMLLALVLFFSGRLPTDIKRWLRHPQLTGVILWALAHLAVNGDQRSLVLFGGLGLWALVEIVAINRRDGAWVRPAPVGLLRSSLPVAIGVVAWVLLARLHPWLSGVAIMPGAR